MEIHDGHVKLFERHNRPAGDRARPQHTAEQDPHQPHPRPARARAGEPHAALLYPLAAGRIRLVAYGARLESVLGVSPRGFESPILRAPKGP